MEETKEKALLAGFSLDEAEMAICNNIIKNYSHKIRERVDFSELRIRLKKTQKGKNWLHEIEAGIKSGNRNFAARTSDYNLFAALAEAMEKLLNELTHKLRTSRQKK